MVLYPKKLHFTLILFLSYILHNHLNGYNFKLPICLDLYFHDTDRFLNCVGFHLSRTNEYNKIPCIPIDIVTGIKSKTHTYSLKKVVEEILGYKFIRGQKYGCLLEIQPYFDPFKYSQ